MRDFLSFVGLVVIVGLVICLKKNEDKIIDKINQRMQKNGPPKPMTPGEYLRGVLLIGLPAVIVLSLILWFDPKETYFMYRFRYKPVLIGTLAFFWIGYIYTLVESIVRYVRSRKEDELAEYPSEFSIQKREKKKEMISNAIIILEIFFVAALIVYFFVTRK